MDEIFPCWYFPLLNKAGLLPLVPRGGVLVFSWFTAFRSFLIVTLSLVSCIYASVKTLTDVSEVNYILKLVLTLTGSTYVGGALIALTTLIKCKLGGFDQTVENLLTFQRVWKSKSAPESKNVDLTNITVIASALVLRILYFAVILLFKGSDEVYKIYYVMTPIAIFHCIHLLMTVCLVILMSIVAHDFRRLNKLVKFCPYAELQSTSGKPAVHLLPGGKTVSVEKIGEMHYLLVRTVAEINSLFGIQSMCLFVVIFLAIVLNPYIIMKFLIEVNAETVHKAFFIIHIIDFLNYGLHMFLITNVADQVKRKSKRTAYHVSGLLSRQLTKDERKEVKYTLAQICNSKANIRVLNLYTVDLSIMTPVVGIAIVSVVLQLRP